MEPPASVSETVVPAVIKIELPLPKLLLPTPMFILPAESSLASPVINTNDPEFEAPSPVTMDTIPLLPEELSAEPSSMLPLLLSDSVPVRTETDPALLPASISSPFLVNSM
jgi:hypothetical protein